MKHDPQQIADRRSNGEKWSAIAADLAVPESTLRGRVRRALQGNTVIRKARSAKVVAAAVTPAAAAITTPAAPAGTFVEPGWYPLLRYALQSEKGVTLFGPRGCGKSTAIRQLAAEVAHPTLTLQCAANMQIDSLLGTWTSKNGTLSFVDGPLTTAVRTGAWLIAEESNVIHPGVWSLVNTLTDHTGEGLRLPTGELVPQSAGFRLVLIYNEGYSGTREVNAALKDRLMPIYCGYLAQQDEVNLLKAKTGASDVECARVQGVADMIRAANLRFDVSPRSLVRWIQLVRVAGLTWGKAYEHAIMDLAGPPDLAAPQRACLSEIAKNTVAQW